MRIHFWLFFCLCTLAVSEKIFAESKTSSATITNLQILEDKTGQLTLDDILNHRYSGVFLPTSNPVNKGYSDSVFWLKFNLDNKVSPETLHYLKIDYSLDDLRFYYPNSDNTYESMHGGETIPQNKRDFQTRRTIFKFSTLSKSTHYLRVYNLNTIYVPIQILSDKELLAQINMEQFLFGAYFGFFFIIFIYSLSIFSSIHDTKYLIYAFYLLTKGIQDLASSHLLQLYILSSTDGITNRKITIFFLGLSFLFLTIFTFKSLSLNFLPKRIKLSIFITLGILSTIESLSVFNFNFKFSLIPTIYFTLIFGVVFLLYRQSQHIKKNIQQYSFFGDGAFFS